MSKLSLENNNAYFTGNSEVRSLLNNAEKLWGLEGKTVLEPSVGSGVFPLTATRLGYDVKWKTNELFPEQTNYQADHNEDFFKLCPKPVDLVLGNPPYSGTVKFEEQRLPLWLGFVNQSFKWADRVAFVLPVYALNFRHLSRLPEGVEVVAWTEPETQPYVLGGTGGSEVKEVQTTTVFYERTGFAGYVYESQPPDGLEWVKSGDPTATHGVSLWGNVAEARCLKKSWGRKFPFSEDEALVRVTENRVEALLASGVVGRFAGRYSTARPSVTKTEVNHLLNVLLKQL